MHTHTIHMQSVRCRHLSDANRANIKSWQRTELNVTSVATIRWSWQCCRSFNAILHEATPGANDCGSEVKRIRWNCTPFGEPNPGWTKWDYIYKWRVESCNNLIAKANKSKSQAKSQPWFPPAWQAALIAALHLWVTLIRMLLFQDRLTL